MLVLDMLEILPHLGKYKYNTWRILPVKCYIDKSMCLWSCIRNVNRYWVLGSPAMLPLEESVVSRLLGHNRRPAVPGCWRS
jgi:hypothetical protein